MQSESFSNMYSIRREVGESKSHFGGPPVHYLGSGYLFYGDAPHNMISGESGSGKTTACILPTIHSLLDSNESFLCTDPKGEIYLTFRDIIPPDYNVVLLDFRNIHQSPGFNPLRYPYELYKTQDPQKMQIAVELLDDLCYAIFPQGKDKDPFWADSARAVLLSAIQILFRFAKPEQCTLANCYYLISDGEERYRMSTVLKELYDALDEDFLPKMLLQTYFTASDTRAGIRSTFLTALSPFVKSQGLVEMLASDDFKINHLDGKKKTAIFLCVPEETPIYYGIGAIIVNQIANHCIRIAHDAYNGTLPTRMNLILDEAANLAPALPYLDHLLSACRSRGIRISLAIQSFKQLEEAYGPYKAATILDNCGLLISFRTRNMETLAELSKRCGERVVEVNGHLQTEPLITPHQISTMQKGQALVQFGSVQYVTKLPPYKDIYGVLKSDAPYPARRMIPVAPHLNLKELISTLRGERRVSEGNKCDDPLVPQCDIDQLLKDLDEKFEDLDKKQNASESTSIGHNQRQFTITIVGFDPSRKGEVISAMKRIRPISVHRISSILEHELPFDMVHRSYADAQFAMRILVRAGAKVVGPSTNDS